MPDDYGNPDPNPDWLQIDWRSHLRRVALPGAEVNYAEIGAGEPIVFVHGISGSWQNWLENLPRFGRGHRAIALDLPGFGASPMPSWPIEMRAYGRLVHDFCEKVGVERGATLVGNSMGGLVAAEAVLSAPGRFDRLVLVSAAGLINTWLPRQRGTATSQAWGTFGPHYRGAARTIVGNRLLRYLTFRFVIRYPGRLRKELLWEQMASGLPADGFADALQSVIEYDARDRLAEIEIPTMIVWGMDDWVISALAALSYHRRIPIPASRSSSAPATCRSWSARSGSTACWRSSSPDGRGQGVERLVLFPRPRRRTADKLSSGKVKRNPLVPPVSP